MEFYRHRYHPDPNNSTHTSYGTSRSVPIFKRQRWRHHKTQTGVILYAFTFCRQRWSQVGDLRSPLSSLSHALAVLQTGIRCGSKSPCGRPSSGWKKFP